MRVRGRRRGRGLRERQRRRGQAVAAGVELEEGDEGVPPARRSRAALGCGGLGEAESEEGGVGRERH
jgi:hypothetical protein